MNLWSYIKSDCSLDLNISHLNAIFPKNEFEVYGAIKILNISIESSNKVEVLRSLWAIKHFLKNKLFKNSILSISTKIQKLLYIKKEIDKIYGTFIFDNIIKLTKEILEIIYRPENEEIISNKEKIFSDKKNNPKVLINFFEKMQIIKDRLNSQKIIKNPQIQSSLRNDNTIEAKIFSTNDLLNILKLNCGEKKLSDLEKNKIFDYFKTNKITWDNFINNDIYINDNRIIIFRFIDALNFLIEKEKIEDSIIKGKLLNSLQEICEKRKNLVLKKAIDSCVNNLNKIE